MLKYFISDDGRIRLEVEFDDFKNEAQDSDLNKKLEDVALELTELRVFFQRPRGHSILRLEKKVKIVS